MIKKFENYIEDDLNKIAIDSVSVIESSSDSNILKFLKCFINVYINSLIRKI
jgi:hypothetical protein